MDTPTQQSTPSPRKPRRSQRWWLLAAIPLLLALYGYFVEPSWMQVTAVRVALPHLPPAFAGFTIVQLSDPHFGRPLSAPRLRKAVELANRAQPDLVVLTGDYLASQKGDAATRARQIADVMQILGALHARYGVYAIWGNHDFWDNEALLAGFTAQRITLLRNAAVPIERRGARLWLAGLDDLWWGTPDPKTALRRVPAGACVVALMHEPDFADTLATYPVDLQLSGHSHGGQLRLPFLGPLHVPRDSTRYREGLHRVGRMLEYTNRGLGTVGPPMRFNDRPEITVVTLQGQ